MAGGLSVPAGSGTDGTAGTVGAVTGTPELVIAGATTEVRPEADATEPPMPLGTLSAGTGDTAYVPGTLGRGDELRGLRPVAPILATGGVVGAVA